jgi:U3 small nucleolar RNA-associated protein 14
MYDRGEKLKRKIAGVNSGDEDSEDDSDGDEEGVQAATARAFKELEDLDDDDLDEENDPQPSGKIGKSGLMEMKFMQNAALRDKAQTRSLMDTFKEELQKLGEDEEGNKITLSDLDHDGHVNARVMGRVSFNPATKVSIRLT